MRRSKQFPRSLLLTNHSAVTTMLAVALLLTVAASQPAQAQTFQVIYNFLGGLDGEIPLAGLTTDQAGNLYGTASYGGNYAGCWTGCGTVFKLTHKGSAWVFNPLYSFAGGNDGLYPLGRVIFGPDGSLYGTTLAGGMGCPDDGGCGTVFKLKPPLAPCAAVLCPWTESVLYRFTGDPDGVGPGHGDLIFDQAGNIYGTTYRGGSHGLGTVYELTPSGGGWTESVLYSFSGNDGAEPDAGVTLDNAGNLYGTTFQGGLGNCNNGCGTVFELMYSVGTGWTENVLYSFQAGNDGGNPTAGLMFDPSGNLYGATITGGQGGRGTVFELKPANGVWTFSTIYGFTKDGGVWFGKLVMDEAGTLYGETAAGGEDFGNVFKLIPSNGNWTGTSLYDFTGYGDGGGPSGGVILDRNGTIYGTTGFGGSQWLGVVFEITP